MNAKDWVSRAVHRMVWVPPDDDDAEEFTPPKDLTDPEPDRVKILWGIQPSTDRLECDDARTGEPVDMMNLTDDPATPEFHLPDGLDEYDYEAELPERMRSFWTEAKLKEAVAEHQGRTGKRPMVEHYWVILPESWATLAVEERHIETGTRKSAEGCPIARAARGRGWPEARVDDNGMRELDGLATNKGYLTITLDIGKTAPVDTGTKGVTARLTLPERVRDALQEYDNGGRMKPLIIEWPKDELVLTYDTGWDDGGMVTSRAGEPEYEDE